MKIIIISPIKSRPNHPRAFKMMPESLLLVPNHIHGLPACQFTYSLARSLLLWEVIISTATSSLSNHNKSLWSLLYKPGCFFFHLLLLLLFLNDQQVWSSVRERTFFLPINHQFVSHIQWMLLFHTTSIQLLFLFVVSNLISLHLSMRQAKINQPIHL